MALNENQEIRASEDVINYLGENKLIPVVDSAEEGTAEVSWAQVVGYTLIDKATGKTVGRIVSIDETTINTLLEVMTPEDEERLIPASTDLIVKVDAEKQTIAMRIPAGLLDL